MATLPGRVHQAIVTAILSAFRPDEFSELFRVTTDRRLEEIVGPANYRSTVSQALDWLESRDVEKRFMLEARQANPTSKALVEIADQVAFGEPVSDALEKAIAGQLPLFDPADFRASMVHVENRVCQLQVDGIDDGTAFLIGPDKVMTNYHVIRRALGKPSPLIVASFDFSAQRSSARQVQSAADWLIDKSPFADVDIKPVAGKEAGPNELDYAIIRLAERIGDDPPNPAASEPRGWIRLDLASPEPAAGDLMLIMQHPGGGPKRCAAWSAS